MRLIVHWLVIKKFEEDEDMQLWINSVFKKVVCKVNDKEFANSRTEIKNIVLTETALEGEEVAIAFCPRNEFSKQLRFLKCGYQILNKKLNNECKQKDFY